MMRIYGIDFTSAPSRRKPITCAIGTLKDRQLFIKKIETWPDFIGFEAWLATPGPWLAGLDFPFGYPAEFVLTQQLPQSWEKYARYLEIYHTGEHVSDRQRYREWIREFREARPVGAKHPKRETDILAGSISPIMVFGVPVGMMLLEGAPRLRRAQVSVVPNHMHDHNCIALETYPGAAVQTLIGQRVKYKSEYKSSKSEQDARAAILYSATGESANIHYGLDVVIPNESAELCLQDNSGDHLDAILCALQAAWAYSLREKGWGVPASINTDEGWIFDPRLYKLYSQPQE